MWETCHSIIFSLESQTTRLSVRHCNFWNHHRENNFIVSPFLFSFCDLSFSYGRSFFCNVLTAWCFLGTQSSHRSGNWADEMGWKMECNMHVVCPEWMFDESFFPLSLPLSYTRFSPASEPPPLCNFHNLSRIWTTFQLIFLPCSLALFSLLPSPSYMWPLHWFSW